MKTRYTQPEVITEYRKLQRRAKSCGTKLTIIEDVFDNYRLVFSLGSRIYNHLQEVSAHLDALEQTK